MRFRYIAAAHRGTDTLIQRSPFAGRRYFRWLGHEPFGDTAVDKVAVAPGVTIEDVATATGSKAETIAALNPQLIGARW